VSRSIVSALALAQVVLGLRVVWRLLRTGGQEPIRAVSSSRQAFEPGSVAIIVPVLDEVTRVAACLDGILAQGPEVGEVLVVDGGSSDGTRDLVREFMLRDPRVRLIAAGPAPDGWNGKVWGLHAGEAALSAGASWVLILDADVRPAPTLSRSLVAHAHARSVRLLSVATAQRLSGPTEGLLHPALLATLVYRFGRPGGEGRTPEAAMANGQCLLIRRDLLSDLGGFQTVRKSLCEDITLARLAARGGDAVGFYEADSLVEVTMYTDWRAAWRNWPRSLTTRDALFGLGGWIGLLEVLLVQALPLGLVVSRWPTGPSRVINRALLALRVGMLFGIARAYPERPLTYWLSPLFDLPVAVALLRSALRRRHTWRGRAYARRNGALVVA
jgi:dolichol-phosphate mannosyltransferase